MQEAHESQRHLHHQGGIWELGGARHRRLLHAHQEARGLADGTPAYIANGVEMTRPPCESCTPDNWEGLVDGPLKPAAAEE